MPDKNENDQLNVQIANLKKNLIRAYEKRKSLLHPEVVAISMLLDEKIVQYMKMKKDNKPGNDLIKEMSLIY